MAIENGMVATRMYGLADPQTDDPVIVGDCEGCNEPVFAFHEYIEHPDGLLHDDGQCCRDFIMKTVEG